MRESALRRDKYTDQYQLQFGRLKPAEVVHHVFPVKDFPEYQFCLWNLISLSRASHNLMHDRYTDELTDVGKNLLRKVARQQGIEIPAEYFIAQNPPKRRGWFDPPQG